MGPTIVEQLGVQRLHLPLKFTTTHFHPVIHEGQFESVAQVLCGADISNWVADKISPLGLKAHTSRFN